LQVFLEYNNCHKPKTDFLIQLFSASVSAAILSENDERALARICAKIKDQRLCSLCTDTYFPMFGFAGTCRKVRHIFIDTFLLIIT